MIKKALLLSAAGGSFAAAAFVCVVAFGFGLYAWLTTYLTPAAAASAVGLTFAAILALAGLFFLMKGKFKTDKAEPNAAEKVLTFARERPLIALAATLGAGFVAFRNPALTATLAAALLAPKPKDKR